MKIPKKKRTWTNCVMQSHIFFLVIDATLASDNLLRFRKNFSRNSTKTNYDYDDKNSD